jgi:hypothetical protein
VLWATGAWELIEPGTPGQKQLMHVVEEMAIASGLPRPRVWIVPDTDPNAFATGRDAATANVAVTEGLLAALSRDELQAVIRLSGRQPAHYLRSKGSRVERQVHHVVGAGRRSRRAFSSHKRDQQVLAISRGDESA